MARESIQMKTLSDKLRESNITIRELQKDVEDLTKERDREKAKNKELMAAGTGSQPSILASSFPIYTNSTILQLFWPDLFYISSLCIFALSYDHIIFAHCSSINTDFVLLIFVHLYTQGEEGVTIEQSTIYSNRTKPLTKP